MCQYMVILGTCVRILQEALNFAGGGVGDIWQIMHNIIWNCYILWHWYFRVCKDFHLDLRFNFRNILVYGPVTATHSNISLGHFTRFSFLICWHFIWFAFFILEGGMVACKEFPQIAAKLCCHSKRSFLLWEIFPGNIQINFLCFKNGAG